MGGRETTDGRRSTQPPPPPTSFSAAVVAQDPGRDDLPSHRCLLHNVFVAISVHFILIYTASTLPRRILHVHHPKTKMTNDWFLSWWQEVEGSG